MLAMKCMGLIRLRVLMPPTKKVFLPFLLIFLLSAAKGQNSGMVRLGLPAGHSDYISSASWSPDGSMILTSSFDKTLIIWDAESGAPLHTLKGHQSLVLTACWSSDGKLVASGSADQTAIIWDVSSGDSVAVLVGHTDAVKALKFSPDGKRLLTGSEDYTAAIWDVAKGRLLNRLTGHRSWVISVEWSPDGKKVLTAAQDCTAAIWNSRNGKQDAVLKGHNGLMTSATFSPDGEKVLTASWDHTACIWDAVSGKPVLWLRGHNKTVYSAVFGPGNGEILTGSSDSTAAIWDAATGLKKVVFRSDAHGMRSCASFSPDGRCIFFNGNLFDAANGKRLFDLQGDNESSDSEIFSPDSKKVLTYFSGIACITYTGNGREAHFLGGHLSEIRTSVFSPDSKGLLFSHWENSAKVLRFDKAPFVKALTGHSLPVESAVYSADGKYILTSSLDCKAIIWNAAAAEKQRVLKGSNRSNLYFAACNPEFDMILAGAWDKTLLWKGAGFDSAIVIDQQKEKVDFGGFSPDSRYCFTAVGARLKIWRTHDGTNLYILNGFASMNYAFFSPDGRYILWDAGGSGAVLSRSTDGRRVKAFRDESGRVNYAAFSHKGDKIATAMNNGYALVWETESGNILSRTGFNDRGVSSVDFSPDGNSIVTGSYDGIARIWSASGGQLLHKLEGHTAPVLETAYSPDGGFIMSRSKDGSVVLWNAITGEMLFRCFMFDQSDWIALTPDRYYYGSKGGIGLLHWISADGKVYSFEQFDLQYNRPDIVLERIGLADSSLIKAFRRAYYKRLEKLHFDESMFDQGFHMPEISILNGGDIPSTVARREVVLDIVAADKLYPLNRIMIWVNGVPVPDMNGLDISQRKIMNVRESVTISLSAGSNKVQASVFNQKGVESLRETLYIYYEPEDSVKAGIYLAVVSVSAYDDSLYNLKYAVKDGRDIVDAFAAKGVSSVDTLFNCNATRENILALKQKFLNSGPDDIVILYFSGHGLLSSELDFYFATHDVDFNNPAVRGLLYDDLEALLDGIPARRKLLLMDACHSGEVDREEHLLAMTDTAMMVWNGSSGHVRNSGSRGIQLTTSVPALGLQNSFELMQDMFVNLSRGSGAFVISAASGTGFALESAEWNNGVFTSCVINGLKNMAADNNHDRKISVLELNDYVGGEVQRLTRGAQKPVSRRENREFDWMLW